MALLACTGVAALMAALLVMVLRALAIERRQLDILIAMLGEDSRATDMKQVASRVIDASRKILDAPGHYLYWQGSPASDATLLALDSEALRARVGVSYASLAEVDDSEYLPPFTLHIRGGTAGVTVTREGDLMFVDVPLGSNHHGLLRVGPFKKYPPAPRALKSLALLARCAGRILDLISQMSVLAGDLGDAQAKASVAMAASVGGGHLAGTLLRLATRVSRAAAGALISNTGQEPRIAAAWGLSGGEAEVAAAMMPGATEPPNPLIFPAGGRHSLILWTKSRGGLPEHLAEALGLVAMRMGQVMGHEQMFCRMSATYVEALKAIVTAMDAADPSSAGHSSRVARYSRDIALAMGLPDPGTIELAGLLHDIGMAALDESVLFKTGKYDHKELEEMKGHVEIGGALAEGVRDHRGLGAFIRHHHERWDGWGYPDGTRGASIPHGARVLAVADAFCAATSGRAYRPAATFGAAVEMLETGAGSQFDAAVVQAFLQWWSDKRKYAAEGKSLEPCWEMIACPPSIATSCPARRSSLNCWTVPGVRCSMHGASCDSCIVHTECLGRHATR